MATTHRQRMADTAAQGREAAPPARWLRIASVIGAVAYCLGIAGYLLLHGGWPTPDYLIPPLLLLAVATGRGPAFLADWGPFLLIILAWQASAGIADQLGRPVHMLQPLQAERWLFRGHLPTVTLQTWLYDPTRSRWYDWLGVIQHALHFVLPVVVGFWLWSDSRRVYWRYLASVLLLFFGGFVTYALYPAAPPWMAGLFEQTPPIHRIAVETVLRLPSSAPVGLAYTRISPNTVAAIPSLHAALPLLIALALIRLKGWRWTPTLLYPLVMGFYLVYLGEHYAIDVLIGYGYAVGAFIVVWVPPWPSVRAPAWRFPVRLPPVLSAAAMPMLAVLSAGVIALTLRPGRSSQFHGPLVPGLQVQVGDTVTLDPQPCGSGASPSLTAGTLLLPTAGRYAAHVFEVDGPGCYVLTANTYFPPPTWDRVQALARRSPIRLRALPSMRQGVQYYSVYTGVPSSQLVDRGFDPAQRLILLVAVADVPDADAAAAAIERLAALTLTPDPALPAAPEAESDQTPAPPAPVAVPVDPPPSPSGVPPAQPQPEAPTETEEGG